MEKLFKITLDKTFDPQLLGRVEDAFHGDNLTLTILHAHLIIERAITIRIVEKLARPEILEDGKYGRWSFASKLSLYIGLYDPPKEAERLLSSFNKLRNMIAHGFEDETKCLSKCLPWESFDTTGLDPIRKLTCA